MTPVNQSYGHDSRVKTPPSRDSAAGYVAAVLRGEIADGNRLPGDKLSENELCDAHQVSRNTVREAFQLLAHERLVVHNLNRGFKVRKPTAEDLADIYRVRRIMECGAIRSVVITPQRLEGLQRAVADADSAADNDDGQAIGSANIRFHRAIGAMAQSARVDEVMDHVLAELRLVFHVMGTPGEFHEPYLPRNRAIVNALLEHDKLRAHDLLASYLDEAEVQLQAAYQAVATTT